MCSFTVNRIEFSAIIATLVYHTNAMETTDFNFWLNQNVKLSNINQVWTLYHAVRTESNEFFSYSIYRDEHRLIIKCAKTQNILIIENEEIKFRFLHTLEYPFLYQGGIDTAKELSKNFA